MPTFVADEIVTAVKLNAGTIRDWTDWTPTPTNLTFGSGVVVARYCAVGSEAVLCRFSFTFGSGSAVGTAPMVTLPVAAHASYVDFYSVGAAFLRDANGSVQAGHVRFNSTSRTQVEFRSLAGNSVSTGVTATAPFTWTTSDVLAFDAIYEVA